MQIIETDDVYSYILSETEWYGKNDAARNAIIRQCKGAAEDRGKRHASVHVQPAPILSISPYANRHRVWHYTAPLPVATQIRQELAALRQEALKAGLNAAEIRDIARAVFE